MGNISKEMKILRMNQKEMLKIKNFVTKIKNVFGRLLLINPELENISVKHSKLKSK